MITASDKAIEKLREYLIESAFKAGLGFRLFVITDRAGKTTFSIKLDRQRQEDEVVKLGNVKAFLDSATSGQIGKCQIDYSEEPDGGFVLQNLDPTS
jgi:Fe-S cluster assembly iron-binding protein IscA